MFHFILKYFIKIIHINIYTETLHVSDTSKYRAVDYIQLKCVKQYNKKRTIDRKNAGFNSSVKYYEAGAAFCSQFFDPSHTTCTSKCW